MPNVMATQPNIGGALCESSMIPFLVPRHKVWLMPAARVPCSNAGNIGQCKTWMQNEFCSWKNSVGGKSPQKCIYSVPAQKTAKHPAKCCWRLLSDIGAVMKRRRETGWNLLGCPKLPNRSQLLVGRSSPYCENMWRRYCCLTSFFPIVDTCLSCEDIARQNCAMVPRCRFFGDFFASCIFNEPHAVHFRHAF